MARKVAADYHDKVSSILAAAARVFAENGYERSTMVDIARAAGFSKASAYHYFDSKEAVLYALLRRSIGDLLEAVSRADPGGAASPKQRLARLIEAYVEAFVPRVSVLTPLLLDLDRLRPDWREEIRQLERRLVTLFADAAAASEVPLPPRIAALLMLGAANWTYYWYDPAGDLPVAALARSTARLLTGLTEPAEPAAGE